MNIKTLRKNSNHNYLHWFKNQFHQGIGLFFFQIVKKKRFDERSNNSYGQHYSWFVFLAVHRGTMYESWQCSPLLLVPKQDCILTNFEWKFDCCGWGTLKTILLYCTTRENSLHIFDLLSDLHEARMRGRGKGNWEREGGMKRGKRLVWRGEERRQRDWMVNDSGCPRGLAQGAHELPESHWACWWRNRRRSDCCVVWLGWMDGAIVMALWALFVAETEPKLHLYNIHIEC